MATHNSNLMIVDKAVNFDFDFGRYAMKPTLAKLRGIIADAG